MVSYLRLADHEVVEFGRIEGVEQALAARPPDLIVLDVMLPDGDGFQLARRIRRDRQVPLLFANRGFGAGRGAGAEAVPVLEKGVLLGYYRTGRMQFQADTANRRFLESLRGTFWVGASASLVIAVLAGLFFSRGLTQPAIRVAEGLERMARGELSARLPEQGASEIAQIVRSANRLGSQRERERAGRCILATPATWSRPESGSRKECRLRSAVSGSGPDGAPGRFRRQRRQRRRASQ